MCEPKVAVLCFSWNGCSGHSIIINRTQCLRPQTCGIFNSLYCPSSVIVSRTALSMCHAHPRRTPAGSLTERPLSHNLALSLFPELQVLKTKMVLSGMWIYVTREKSTELEISTQAITLNPLWAKKSKAPWESEVGVLWACSYSQFLLSQKADSLRMYYVVAWNVRHRSLVHLCTKIPQGILYFSDFLGFSEKSDVYTIQSRIPWEISSWPDLWESSRPDAIKEMIILLTCPLNRARCLESPRNKIMSGTLKTWSFENQVCVLGCAQEHGCSCFRTSGSTILWQRTSSFRFDLLTPNETL